MAHDTPCLLLRDAPWSVTLLWANAKRFYAGPSIVCLRRETKWTGWSLPVSNFIVHPFTRRNIYRRFFGKTYEVSSEFILLLHAAGWEFCLLRMRILACSWSWECWVYSVPSKADTVLAWQVMAKISSGFEFECPFLKPKKIIKWVIGHQGHPHSSLNFCTLASADESSFKARCVRAKESVILYITHRRDLTVQNRRLRCWSATAFGSFCNELQRVTSLWPVFSLVSLDTWILLLLQYCTSCHKLKVMATFSSLSTQGNPGPMLTIFQWLLFYSNASS